MAFDQLGMSSCHVIGETCELPYILFEPYPGFRLRR